MRISGREKSSWRGKEREGGKGRGKWKSKRKRKSDRQKERKRTRKRKGKERDGDEGRGDEEDDDGDAAGGGSELMENFPPIRGARFVDGIIVVCKVKLGVSPDDEDNDGTCSSFTMMGSF